MRYSKPSVRERGKGRWQVRIRYKDEGEWKTYACSVEATSRRAAKREADGIRQRLEFEAELGPAHPMDPGDDAALVKNYLTHYIDGLESSGQIEATTAAGYRSSTKHITRSIRAPKRRHRKPNSLDDARLLKSSRLRVAIPAEDGSTYSRKPPPLGERK